MGVATAPGADAGADAVTARERKLCRAERHVDWLRALVVAFVWLALDSILQRPSIEAGPVLLLTAIGTLYTAVAHLARRRSWSTIDTRVLVTAGIDAVLVLAGIWVTGGAGSPLTPLLFVAMAATAYRFEMGVSLGFGAVYAFGYVGIAMSQPTTAGPPIDLVLQAGLLLATGLLASLTSEGYLEAERERSRTERTYEDILRAVPSFVTVVSRDGRIEYLNGRDASPGLNGEMNHGDVTDWVAEEAEDIVDEALQAVFEEGETVEYEVPAQAPGGERAYYRSVAAPLVEDGEILAAVIGSVDITRRLQVEEELRSHARALERSNETLSRYARLMAHDLREPIRDIVRYLQRIDRRERGLSAASREELDFVVRRARHLDELVRSLHGFAEVDERQLTLEPVDLDDAVQEALHRVQTEPGRGLHVDTGELPRVIADRRALVQILEQLIENGYEHGRDDPVRVRVDADRKPEGWCVRVQDDGPGIPPAHHDRVLEPFQRLEANQDGHVGMGLATARRLVERLGGHIELDSEVGEGTCVEFTLPQETVSTEEETPWSSHRSSAEDAHA